MTTHLRRHIENGALLYPEQLANALRRQEIYGGSLDTALLELELVDAATLAHWLHAACGLVPADPSLLVRQSGRPWDAVDVELRRLAWAIPLARQDGQLVIAVHPDLPDEQLGALYRTVPGMLPVVAPECCMEALRAEWLGSVVPQRYAVLQVAYIGSLQRGPQPRVHEASGVPHEVPAVDSHGPIRSRRTATLRFEEHDPVPPPEGPPTPMPPLLAAPAPDAAPAASAPPAAPLPVPERPPVIDLPIDLDAALPDPPPPHAPPQPSRQDTAVGPAPQANADDDAAADPPPARSGDTVRAATETASGPSEAPSTDAPSPAEAIPTPTPATRSTLDPHDEPPPRARTGTILAPPATGSGSDTPTPRPPLPDAIITDGPRADSLPHRDHHPQEPADTEIVDVPRDHDPQPRARFTRQGTLIGDEAGRGKFNESDLVRRMAGARAVLQTTRSRDAAIEAVLTATMVISPRVALFRVRGAELVGLSTPRSKLPDVGGKVVPMDEGSPIANAVADANFVGRLSDPDLSLALGSRDAPTCALRRIDVMGRPVLVLYIDSPTREFLPAELEQLQALCADASEAFEAILKLRHAKHEGRPPSGGRNTPSPNALGLGPHPNWGLPSDRLRAAYGHDDHVIDAREAAPPPLGDRAPPITDEDGIAVRPVPPAEERSPAPHDDELSARPPPVSAPVGAEPPSTEVAPDRPTIEPRASPDRAPDGGDPDGDANGGASEEVRATEELAPGLEVGRITDPVPEAVDDDAEAVSARLTVHSAPPPPPLPPPPVRFAVVESEDAAPRPPATTLTGVPPEPGGEDTAPPPGSGPIRLPLNEELEIISLASPIDQPTVRGRITLDEDDYRAPESEDPEGPAARIAAEVTALEAGEGDVDRLREYGEAGWAALAAALPGPVEVLRRDLRALPPPAAHGPLIRAAIAAGPVVVPHLLQALDHDNPDARFYGAYIFQELRDDRCVPLLAALAFDVSGDVRVIAMRVLETYSRADSFAAATAEVRERLDSDNRTELLCAARAVGTLRDVEAIARLIDLLASKDRFTQEAAIESLCSITGQQLGLKPHRWKSWYIDNRERHRIEWIIDSLRHKDMPVRQWAAHELSRITGHRIAFSPVADKRARESAVREWTHWWNAEGKARLGADAAGL